MANQGRELYEFGPFRLDPEKRVLLRDSQPVPLQLKAFETLLVLVRHSQQVVLKDELMKAVWPDTFVEEANLSQNIFVLRKVLGASTGSQKYIDTIPGVAIDFRKMSASSRSRTLWSSSAIPALISSSKRTFRSSPPPLLSNPPPPHPGPIPLALALPWPQLFWRSEFSPSSSVPIFLRPGSLAPIN